MFNISISKIYKYLISFIYEEEKPKFEKPRGYKNITSNELRSKR